MIDLVGDLFEKTKEREKERERERERERGSAEAVTFSSSRIGPPLPRDDLVNTNTNTLKRQKGMWGSESVCQRSHVSLRGVLPSPVLCRE